MEIDHVFASGAVVGRATTHSWGRQAPRCVRSDGRPHSCVVAGPTTAPDAKTWSIIGIDHDTVCAGVGGTAIRHSTSCAGRRAAACGRAGRHNECCAWWQYHPRQRRPYKWSISILPRSQFYKKQGKLAFSTSCTAVRPHRRLRNDAWRRDS